MIRWCKVKIQSLSSWLKSDVYYKHGHWRWLAQALACSLASANKENLSGYKSQPYKVSMLAEK